MEKDIVYYSGHQIEKRLESETGLVWIMDRGMHGMLMSIYSDFIAVKSTSSLLNVTEKIHKVLEECGFDRESIN